MAQEQSPKLRRVMIIAIGSRGDVQPYIAVGAALQKRGIHVRFYTSSEFISFAREFGLSAVSIRESTTVMFQRETTIVEGMADGDFRKVITGIARLNCSAAPLACSVIKRDAQSGHRPDLALTTPLAKGLAWYLAIEYGIPFMEVSCQALIYNSKHMPMGMLSQPFGLNYFKFYGQVIPSAYNMQLAFFGKGGFDMDIQTAYPREKFVADYRRLLLPRIVLWSPTLAETMHPCRSSMWRFVGSTVIETAEQCRRLDSFGGSQVKEQIESFLTKDAAKPVYIGWGSMICKSKEYMVELCIRALYHSGQRGIILGGYAKLEMDTLKSMSVEPDIVLYAEQNVLFVSEAPHEWLFPQVAATVHHGGAGTTTAALRAGVPTVVTPVFADQFEHSRLVRDLQVGVGFAQQLQQISWRELGDAIQRVVTDQAMGDRARALGKTLRAEDGASGTADEVECFWKTYCVTGKFQELFPGRPSYLLTWKVSTAASCVAVVVLYALLAQLFTVTASP